jgi:hypothetical protein
VAGLFPGIIRKSDTKPAPKLSVLGGKFNASLR